MARGYQRYRGRTPTWKKALVAGLVLVLVAAVLVILLQPKLVFDADGTHLEKDPDDVISSTEETGDVDLEDDFIIDIEEPKAENTPLLGVTVDAGFILGDQAPLLAEGQRPVATVKLPNQSFLFTETDAATAAAMKEKNRAAGTVMRVSAFADTRRADSAYSLAVMSVSGKAWRDPNGNAWLDPYDSANTAYLVDIVKQCVALGATEIVLDDLQFPTYGIVNRVTYGDSPDTAQTRAAAINGVLDAVAAAVEGQDVQLSIALPASLLETGRDDTAGWELASIAPKVDHIYMDAADQAAADSARAAISALRPDVKADVFFVAETAVPITGGSYVLVK